jgi:DNA-directed RNA polymerase subunit RPC12/RpoP
VGVAPGETKAWHQMGTLADQQSRPLAAEFSCHACGSPAVVFPDHLSDDAPVRCQRCRTVLCTLREFRLSVEKGRAVTMQIRAGSGERGLIGSGRRLLDRLFQRLASP